MSDPIQVHAALYACLHGVDASQVKLHHDPDHDAIYVYLHRDETIHIRIQLKPQKNENPQSHATGLRRDYQGMLRLAAVISEAARMMGQQLKDIEADGVTG